jgi:hypothetical protein
VPDSAGDEEDDGGGDALSLQLSFSSSPTLAGLKEQGSGEVSRPNSRDGGSAG